MGHRAALLLLALVTYSQNVGPILGLRCVECHGPGAGLDLSRFPFAHEDDTDQVTLVQRIINKTNGGAAASMPPPGNRPKLTPSQVGMIQQWLAGGLAP